MNAANYDLHIAKGEDFPFEFWIEIDDVVLDLTGASVYAQIRETKERTATKIIDFTVTVDGVAVTNPAPTDNVIKLYLTDTQTAGINADQNSGFYDVLVVDSAGNDTYYLQGKVTFHKTVTVKP